MKRIKQPGISVTQEVTLSTRQRENKVQYKRERKTGRRKKEGTRKMNKETRHQSRQQWESQQ